MPTLRSTVTKFSTGRPTFIYLGTDAGNILPSGLTFRCSDGSATFSNVTFYPDGGSGVGYYSATFTAGPIIGAQTITAPGFSPGTIMVGLTSTRSGTHLAVVPAATGFTPNFAYNTGGGDDSFNNGDLQGHVLHVAAGNGFAGGDYGIYATIPGANINPNGNPENKQNLLQLKPLLGSPNLPEGATGGEWSIMLGRRGAGLSGSNLCYNSGFWVDPDSPIGSGMSGATVRISGGTGFVAGDYPVNQYFGLVGTGDLNYQGPGFQIYTGASSDGAWGATWEKVGGVTILSPTVHADYTGSVDVGIAGDSIADGVSVNVEAALRAQFPNANSINVVRLGRGGSTTQSWRPDDTSHTYFADAVAAMNAAGTKWLAIMLGANDAHSVALNTYLGNLQTTVTAFRAQVSTLQGIVLMDLLAQSASDSANTNAIIPQYTAGYSGITGATPGLINSQTNYAIFLAAPQLLSDGIHPGADGYAEVIYTWLESLAPYITGTSGGGGGDTTPPAAPVITSPTTAAATVGVPFSYTITATNSPTSYGATGLPAGLTRTGDTISGTPTVAGTTTISVSATNAGGTASQTVTITVAAAPVTAVYPAQNKVAAGEHYGPTGTEYTGSLPVVVPAARSDVRYNVDRGDGTLGTLHVPTASQVLLDVLVDATAGNVVLPAAGDVRARTQFGVNGTGTTGTLTITSGGSGLTDDQAAALSRIDTAITARLDAAISSRSTFAGGAVASVTAPVTAGAVMDKSGYSGAATNLPSDYQQRGVAVTLPTTPPTGYGASGGGLGLDADTIAKLVAAEEILLASQYVPTDAPVLVIPQPTNDPTLCTVYAYLETPQGAPAASVQVSFALSTPAGAKDANGKLISGRQVTAATNSAGYLQVILERNDKLTPTGSRWAVTSAALGWRQAKSITLQAETFDLGTIV